MSQGAGRTGVVLSGGGAYGAFEIGVMKTLFAGRSPATSYQPLAADIFSGTSVGAFNAAALVTRSAGNCLDSALWLENIWLELVADRPGRCGNGIFRIRANPADLIDPNCLHDPVALAARVADDTVALSAYLLSRTANFLASSDPLEDRFMALMNVGSFVDSSPYHALLCAVVTEQEIRKSPFLLSITATDWVAGTARHFSNHDFQDGVGINAIMASTAIPGIFPPVIIGGQIYVDGGVVENTPLKQAIQAGATSLHVIYLDPNPRVIRLRGQRNTIDTLLRVYYIMLATKLAEDIETARWINAGLDAIEGFSRHQTISETALRDFVRAAGELIAKEPSHYRRLTIHRYFPERPLGGNLGMLDFGLDTIAQMIAEGERVALVHDCKRSGCVL